MLSQLLHIDLAHWVATLGLVGLFLIIFCESGLFFGCILPGDSLLITAGMLSQRGLFNLELLLIVGWTAAVLGYATGYIFGNQLGHWLLKREDGIFFKRRYIQQAHDFFDHHGGKALILCRLLPIVRTFCPIVAGMGEMALKPYTLYTLIGATIWVGGMVFVGDYLSRIFPGIVHYILPVAITIIVLSVLPGVFQILKKRYKSR